MTHAKRLYYDFHTPECRQATILCHLPMRMRTSAAETYHWTMDSRI